MTDRKLEVLTFLSKDHTWKTAAEISAALGFSVRSVKSYISELNSMRPQLISASHKGFLLNNYEEASSLLQVSPPVIPQSREERISHIIKKLVIEDKSCHIYRLSEDLCISSLTLQNDISYLKPLLAKFELALKTKDNMAEINGSEKNKKKLISYMIYNETKAFCCSLDSLQPYLPQFNLKIMKQLITDIFKQNCLFMDDFLVLNFIIHIGITMQRSQTAAPAVSASRTVLDSASGEEPAKTVVIPAPIKKVMESISDEIRKYFSITLAPEDIYDLSILLMSQAFPQDSHSLLPDNFDDVILKDVNELFEIIQGRVRHIYHLNLNSEKFSLRFKLHLRNLLIRLHNKIQLRNPQFLSIKENFPFIYDISVFIADLIQQQTRFHLSEDEIAYITLHIGVLIEEQKALSDKIPVVVVNPQYYSVQVNLLDKLQLLFDQNIIILGVASSTDELRQFRDYDLIISTIPFYPLPGVPVVQVSSQLGIHDISSIISHVERIKSGHMQLIIEQKLKYLFHENLFFFHNDFTSEEEAISFLADRIEEQGFVDSRFKQELFKRESISSSAYGNIAIPHPLELCAKESVIAVSLHPAPIKWKGNHVNLVLMLAIRPSDQEVFNDIFDFVSQVISNNRYLQSLTATDSYQEFIDLLLSHV